MKPQFYRNDSHLAYLEPPHSHDPTSVSSIASLPAATLESLPVAVQSALYGLRQSTSIVYASYIRLQDALQDRFDRLMPTEDIDGELTFSESSFFNYTNSLCAERTYLLSDAHPDWRHKSSIASVALQPYFNVSVDPEPIYPGLPSTVSEWWDYLQSAVESWCDYASVVHIPDFEDTVGEYLTIQRQPPALAIDLDDSPLETPLTALTPTLEKEPTELQFYQIREKDFVPMMLPDKLMSTKTTVLDMNGLLGSVRKGCVLEEDEGNACDERKDSGIAMSG